MGTYPRVNIEQTIEHGPSIVDEAIKHGEPFHSYANVDQRVDHSDAVDPIFVLGNTKGHRI